MLKIMNDGTVEGAPVVSGASGTNYANIASLFFDGVDDDVDLGSNSIIGPTLNFTVSAWILWRAGAGALPRRTAGVAPFLSSFRPQRSGEPESPSAQRLSPLCHRSCFAWL